MRSEWALEIEGNKKKNSIWTKQIVELNNNKV